MERNDMAYETLTFSQNNGITAIGLNRPKVLNALNLNLIRELENAIATVAGSGDTRALILFGEGSHFAAGADIAEMTDLNPARAAQFSFTPVFNALSALSMPVIAAIDGYALGGGLELALACDIRICTSSAKFGLPEVTVGVFPGAGGTQRLPKLIGPGRAAELIFTGRIIDAKTALEWGICSHLVESDVKVAGMDLAGKIAMGPPLAIAAAKSAMKAGQESKLWAGLFASHDQKEGMAAFLDKRKPVFNGN
jgi:enoyl-CoA hydratase